MNALWLALMLVLGLAACATNPKLSQSRRDGTGTTSATSDTSSGSATRLRIDNLRDAREAMLAVPAEAAMERFEMIDQQRRVVSYVGFTETNFGGLVFVNRKLVGTVSPAGAQAFYSCRGYTTATHHHWAKDAKAWIDGLLEASSPVTVVELDFSGKSTSQSIREVIDVPLLTQMGSLFGWSTNPFSLFKKLDSAHDAMLAQENFDKTLLRLSAIVPGMSEASVGEIVKPEDLSFVSGGMIMAYPKYSVEFFVSDGEVKVIQQPSFHQLARSRAAMFYATNMQWERCTPSEWQQALPPPDAVAKAAR